MSMKIQPPGRYYEGRTSGLDYLCTGWPCAVLGTPDDPNSQPLLLQRQVGTILQGRSTCIYISWPPGTAKQQPDPCKGAHTYHGSS